MKSCFFSDFGVSVAFFPDAILHKISVQTQRWKPSQRWTEDPHFVSLFGTVRVFNQAAAR